MNWVLGFLAIIFLTPVLLQAVSRYEDKLNLDKKRSLAKKSFEKLFSTLLTEDTVILDTETTGLSKSSEIVEISIIDIYGNVLLDTLVKPKRKIRSDNKAVAIHGITNEMLIAAPQWKDIHEQVCSIVSGKNVVIYNAEFDLRLMEQTAKKYDLTMPDIYAECLMMVYGAWDGTPSKYNGFKWHKLTDAAKTLGVTIVGKPHRSLTDCKTTLGVLKKMNEKPSPILTKKINR